MSDPDNLTHRRLASFFSISGSSVMKTSDDDIISTTLWLFAQAIRVPERKDHFSKLGNDFLDVNQMTLDEFIALGLTSSNEEQRENAKLIKEKSNA